MAEPLSNVRLVSNGVPAGTNVEVDGTPIDGVVSIKWEMRDCVSIGVLTVVIEGVEVDALAELIDARPHATD